DTEIAPCVEFGFVDIIGIDLEAHLTGRIEIKPAAQHSAKVANIIRRKHGGRAASQMHGTDPATPQMRANRLDFSMKRQKIGFDRLVAQDVLGVAGAEPA